jgi:hypothetical protein
MYARLTPAQREVLHSPRLTLEQKRELFGHALVQLEQELAGALRRGESERVERYRALYTTTEWVMRELSVG